jgi:DNA-binding transcriptional regulator YhcF (GntR family)
MRFRVDFKSGKPAYLQIIEQVQASVESGELRPGDPLPTVAVLAEELRLNRNAISKAYVELERADVTEAASGGGYIVRDRHSPLQDRRRKALMATGSLSKLPAESHPPLQNAYSFVKRMIGRFFFAKRSDLLEAFRTIKAQASLQSDLESLLSLTTAKAGEVLDARVELISGYSELISLVTSFPSLRSKRASVRASNGILMPVFSDNELTGVLQISRKTGAGMKEFDPDDLEFMGDVADQIGLWTSHFRFRKEKQEAEYALDIQRGLLPREIPQAPGFTIAGHWQPARTVGGDYYDVLKLSQTKFALVIADVSGKGIPASLLMANLQATVKAYASEEAAPAEICAKVNRAVCNSTTVGKFITFFYAVLDTAARRVSYCCAGHNPAILVRQSGSYVTLEAGGPVLGILPDATYEDDSVQLASGDRLVIFTDGVTEATDLQDEEFGEERLTAILKKNNSANAAELRDRVMRSVSEFCHDDFPDDATLLTVCVE